VIEDLRRRLARYPRGTRWSWRLHAIRWCRRQDQGAGWWNRRPADDREMRILLRMVEYADRRDTSEH